MLEDTRQKTFIQKLPADDNLCIVENAFCFTKKYDMMCDMCTENLNLPSITRVKVHFAGYVISIVRSPVT